MGALWRVLRRERRGAGSGGGPLISPKFHPPPLTQHALNLATPPPPLLTFRRSPVALALAALVLLTGLALLARPFHHAGRPDCVPASASARVAFYNDAALSRQFNRTMATESPSAQSVFNRGWLLLCGFHSEAAIAAFRAAATSDPTAALPHCGIALALGPGANRAALDVDLAEGEASPFPAFRPAGAPAATAAAAECARLAAAALAADPTSPLAARDAVWAAAVVARFAPGTERGERRLAADLAFADEMDSIAATHADPDAAALAADARIATRAWDYRDGASGRMLPHAAGAAASARAALARAPRHLLALHILVHLHETGAPARCGEGGGGTTPADLCASEGEGVAGALAEAGPWTTARVGHLLHMPGHLFSRIGFYADAVRSGLAAIAADEAAGRACVEAYAVEHNAVSLASAASANGDAHAEAAALRALARLPFHGGPAMLYAGGTVDVATVSFHRIMAADWRSLETAPRPGPRERTACLAGGREAATVAWTLGRALAACARAQRAAVRGNATGQARDVVAAARARARPRAPRSTRSPPPRQPSLPTPPPCRGHHPACTRANTGRWPRRPSPPRPRGGRLSRATRSARPPSSPPPSPRPTSTAPTMSPPATRGRWRRAWGGPCWPAGTRRARRPRFGQTCQSAPPTRGGCWACPWPAPRWETPLVRQTRLPRRQGGGGGTRRWCRRVPRLVSFEK